MGRTAQAATPRVDIQGLRTLAVLSVVVYHVWPGSLSGGFVGVDIFFVISGFLITTHLVARPPASARDFVGFWGRRLRRLLPAALTVLLATLAATRLFGPDTLWENTARQGMAAGLYSVNWLLAGDAVDYLAASNPPTPVQHYWSLSVEEQFYLVWPLLIGLLVWLASRTGLRRTWLLGAGMGAVAAASLAWSVHLTATQRGAAYFVTPTRIWELAAGGLTALAVAALPAGGAPRVRAGAAWLGVGLMAYALVTYDAQTAFPGSAAAVPVLGAALVIAAGAGTQWWSPVTLMAPRPVQWIGDVSYSLYLWHWPLVVLVGARVGGLDLLTGSAVVLVSVLLAALTQHFVEAPFRTRAWSLRVGATYRWAVAGMAIVLAASYGMGAEVDWRKERAATAADRALASGDPCLGAGSLDPRQQCGTWQGDVVPQPAQALADKGDIYAEVSGRKDCAAESPEYRPVTCTFGASDSALDVTLMGNSHASQWLPALQSVASENQWRITTRVASRCPAVGLKVWFETEEEMKACRAWANASVTRAIKQKPDLVVLANRISRPVPGKTERVRSAGDYTRGYRSVLARFKKAGIPVLVLADTPAPVDGGGDEVIPDCLARNGLESSACDGTRDTWITPRVDPGKKAVAATDSPLITFADLNDHICGPEVCPAVVGGVIVYYDDSHLTATYATTLAPVLEKEVQRALRVLA